MSHYHIHRETFQVGQLIEPGAMGKVIREQYTLYETQSSQDLVWRMFQEQTFELIRLAEFNSLPSRYTSIFLFESLQDAQDFIRRDGREGSRIYEVDLVNDDASYHRASMRLYERIPLGRPVFPALEEQARQYWSGINLIDQELDFCAEILVESAVIVKAIT